MKILQLFSILICSNVLFAQSHLDTKYKLISYINNNIQNVEIINNSLKITSFDKKDEKEYRLNIDINFSEFENLYIPSEYSYRINEVDTKEKLLFDIQYTTETNKNEQIWINKKKVDTIITSYPSITYNSILFIIPNLNFKTKGTLARYNMTKPTTWRSSEENVAIIYEDDIDINNEYVNIKLKKVIVKNEDIIYIFWINENNEIIIGTLGNDIKRTFYRDLGINSKIAFKEIFDEIRHKGVQRVGVQPKN